MSILDLLLGRRAKTAPNIATEIEAQTAAIETARAKIEAAQAARKAAIDAFDADAHRAADEAIAEAGRDVERRENAIEKLTAAHAERLDLDQREAFHRDDADLAAKGAELETRIAREYPAAAATIVSLLDDIEAFRDKHLAMRGRARGLGETSLVRDPEDSRGATEATVGSMSRRPDKLEATVGNLPAFIVGDAPYPSGEARFWPRASA